MKNNWGWLGEVVKIILKVSIICESGLKIMITQILVDSGLEVYDV
jgi:hypothetical protein